MLHGNENHYPAIIYRNPNFGREKLSTYAHFMFEVCLLERRWQMDVLQRLLIRLMLKRINEIDLSDFINLDTLNRFV